MLYSFENASSTDLLNKKALLVYAVFIENSNIFRTSFSIALLFCNFPLQRVMHSLKRHSFKKVQHALEWNASIDAVILRESVSLQNPELMQYSLEIVF